jgi:TonB-dependent starch-binding outer membrane protein SusC
MKKIRIYGGDRSPIWNKCFRLMKLTFLFLFVGLMQLTASVYSQTTKLSLEMQKAKVTEVLDAIEKQSEFRFAYSPEYIDLDREVTIDINERTIEESLQLIFAGTNVEFSVYDRHIILYPEGMADVELVGKTLGDASQERTITGRVTDSRNLPLPGVTVLIKGTTRGTVTDMDGNYSLDVPSGADVLQFSFVGMQTREIQIGTQATINVMLQEETIGIEEVVAIGYGTVKKADLTGAVSVVKTDDLKKTNAGTIGNQMQGLATGVNVRSTGRAGEDAFIEIRGVGTLSNRTPLWIIDGMISNPGADFNPADIESIQILKDASTAAIYGSRAANGVIIVTTKKGKEGPMEVNVSVKESFDWSPRYDLMNAKDYKFYNDLAYEEGIKDGVWNFGKQDHWNNDTDWQDAVLKTALVQDYNVSLSGGNDIGNYLISGGYYNNEGVTYGNTYERYSARVNTSGRKGIFSFGENLFFSSSNKDPLQTNPYNDFLRMMPTIPIYDENNPGGYGYGSEANARTFGTNPVAREDLEYQFEKQHRLNGVFWAELDLFPWLKYKLNAGIDYYFYNRSWFRGEGNWTLNQEYRAPEGQKQSVTTLNKLIEHTLNLDREFGSHHVDAVLGTTYQTYKSESLGAARLNFPLVGGEYLTVLDAGQTNQTNYNSIGENAIISYLGRVNYNYDSKYYLTFTLRRDGTSKLSKDNRWGNFPSVSAAWRISRENFFNVDWVDDLKLRANWGKLGNAAIGNWDYVGTVNQTIVTVFGTGQKLNTGATQVSLVNTDLRWETKETINVGADASFLDQRLSVGAEYYNSKTYDVLTGMPIAISTGNQGGAPMANAASLKNTGFEVDLGWRDNVNEFQYNVTAGITTLSNEVIDLGYGRDVYYTNLTTSSIGEPLSMFYLLKTDGLFRSQSEIDNYVTSNGTPIRVDGKLPKLGDVKYIDTDDNGQITANDRQIVGSPWPGVQLSLIFNANWRNFDAFMSWYGQFGNDVYNVAQWQGRYFADNSNYLNFEKGEEPYQVNPDSNTPRIIYNDTRNTRESDRYLENGSYFRMKNFQIGYNFAPEMIQKMSLSNLRVYVSGNNLITFTAYKGLDPDFINTNVWNRGTDSFAFPNTRSFMMGLEITF